MSIAPVCDYCRNELDELGGLLFSPPSNGAVLKFHLCVGCYEIVFRLMEG